MTNITTLAELAAIFRFDRINNLVHINNNGIVVKLAASEDHTFICGLGTVCVSRRESERNKSEIEILTNGLTITIDVFKLPRVKYSEM